MKHFFSVVLVLTFVMASYAQSETTSQVNLTPFPSTGFKASYMGSIIYPGFKLGIERPIKVTQVEKQKKNGVKTYNKERYLTLNLGFYHHPTFHDNFYLLAEYQMRRQKSKGWFWEFSPGLGYSRTFLGGTTYNVSDNGEVTKASAAGYNYGMFSLAGGFGYDFSKRSDIPMKIFFKPSLIFMAPYNSFVYMRPTVELGVIYSAGNFWKANPKIKSKKK
jgi:hypothetical protein